uniref:Uncharacterized protein n=1 Tax=Tetradesmus obliquus TaxID=3088 RepID=A0A383VEV3_TETOB|eukprot:jgi/Sobl393_1/15883/SZX63194.1
MALPGGSQALLLQSAALPLLLQHSSVHGDVQAVLQLCCTSKAMRAAVLQHCEGRLDVSLQLSSTQHAERFAQWLTACGQLAGTLRCWPAEQFAGYVSGDTAAERLLMLGASERIVTAALVKLQAEHQLQQQQQQQGGQQGGLQLSSLTWHCAGSSRAAAQLLQVLPRHKLLQLALVQEDALEQDQEQEPSSAASIPADSIAAFSKLQSLAVRAAISAEQLQHALPALTALTHLCFKASGSDRCSREQFVLLQQALPVQLIHLSLEVVLQRHVQPPPLQLSHLSQLTSLETLLIERSSQLPPQLLRLQCSKCSDVQPLLQCKQLQQLDLFCCVAGQQELRRLSRLTGLTHLGLIYAEHMYIGCANDAAAAWPMLAGCIRSLNIHGLDPGGLTAASFQQIKQLTKLTQLSIQVSDDHDGEDGAALPVTPAQCAEVLAALSALQTLELSLDPGRHLLLHPGAAQEGADAEAAAAGAAADAAQGEEEQAGEMQAAAGAAGAALPHHAAAAAAPPPAEGLQQQEGALPAAQAPAAMLGLALLQQQQQMQHQLLQQQQQLQQELLMMMQQQQAPPQLQQMVQAVLAPQILLQAQQQQQQQAAHAASPDMLPVTRVISQLPHLRSLELRGSGLSLEAVELLTQLTQLTRLTMSGCDFDEAAFNSLVLSLRGLKKLSIGGSDLVGDAGLVLVAGLLSQLTALNLCGCSRVSDRGVLQLTRLRNLKLLLAEDTAVSRQAVARVRLLLRRNAA